MFKKVLTLPLLMTASPALAFHVHCDISKLNGELPESRSAISIEKIGSTTIRFIGYGLDGQDWLRAPAWSGENYEDNDKRLAFSSSNTKASSLYHTYEFEMNRNTNEASLVFDGNSFTLDNCEDIEGFEAHQLD